MLSSTFRTLARAAILLALNCTAAFAQSFTTATVVPVSGSPQLMGTADFDGDGRPDIAYLDAYTGGNLHILLGNGNGTFRSGQVLPVAGSVGVQITVADINGDGHPDILMGYDGFIYAAPSLSVTVYLGNGDGTFQAPIYSPALSGVSPPGIGGRYEIGDFDGDHLPDLIYTDGVATYFMKGDGRGHLAAPKRIVDYSVAGIAADVNGDGRLDLVTSGGGNGIVVYFGNGDGTFTASAPSTVTGASNFFFADIDGDGHIDGVAADSSGNVSVAYGRADGTFAPSINVAQSQQHYPTIAGVADLHGDHHPRIFLVSSEGASTVLGASPASMPLYAATGSVYSQSVIADFDGDGYADFAVPGDNCIVLLAGKSDGTFTAAPSYQTGSYVGGLAVLDDTSDGIPDVILSSGRVFAGLGDGTFGTRPIGTGGGLPFLLYNGDFDGNGRLGFYGYESINHNDGDGTFTIQFLASIVAQAAPFPTGYAAIADFNRDGRDDVALSASRGGPYFPSASGNAVYIGSSATGGNYTNTALNFTEPVGPLGAGDFDGDGCPDLAVGAATQIEIFKGDCKGNFSSVASYATGTGTTVGGTVGGFPPSLEPSDIAVTDLDSDGHLDLVYTIPGLSLAKVLYGRGDGTFVAGPDIALAHSSLYVTTADLDSDGHPDLIFTGHTIATIYHGQGSRTLSSPVFLAAGYQTGKAVVADLNRDGNPDIVIPNLDFDGGANSNDNGFTFTVFVNPLAPRIILTSTSTTLTSSLNPSVTGQTVTFTSSVTSTNGTPTGSIQFSDGTTVLATQPLSPAGIATFATNALAVGVHTITATYAPTGTFAGSSASISQTVDAITNTVNVTSSVNPSTYGQSVTITAHVSSNIGTALAGNVAFYDGTLLATVPLDASGNAAYVTSSLTVGGHVITAVFTPLGTGPTYSGSYTQQVNGLASSTLLTANPASGIGQVTPVTLTANVSSALAGSRALTGSVIFYLNGAQLATAALVNGAATYTGTLPPGVNQLYANYAGDPNHVYAASISNTVTVTMSATPTTLTLASSAPTSPALVPVTFTAQLFANTGPATIVSVPIVFTIDGKITGTVTTGNQGIATLTTSTLAPGTHIITASFAGDLTHGAPTPPTLTEQITADATVTTLAGPIGTLTQLDPVPLLAAAQSAYATAIPTGSVTIFEGTTALATLAFTPGTGSFSTASILLNPLTPGTHILVAVYTPDTTSFLPSQSAPFTLIVVPASFTLTLSDPTLTLQTGHHHAETVSLTSIGGLGGTFTLGCGAPLPTYTTCTWAQTSVALPPSGTVSTSLTIDTDQLIGFLAQNRIDKPAPPTHHQQWLATTLATLIPFALLGLRRRNKLRPLLSLVLLATLAGTLTACGADKYPASTAPGTYVVSVTAIGPAIPGGVSPTKTVNLTLIVAP